MSEIAQVAKSQPCCAALAAWTERLAFLVACIAVAGSLYLTLGWKLIACPLCLYQRLFAMSVVAVLLSGWLFIQSPGRGLTVLALPLSVGGLTVALLHVTKEWQGAMVCPLGLLYLGTAPQQSAAAFALLTLLLTISVLSGADREVWLTRGVPAIITLGLIGAAMAFAMIYTGPPPSGGDSLQALREKQKNRELPICTPAKPADGVQPVDGSPQQSERQISNSQ